jgi:hypothetical protein
VLHIRLRKGSAASPRGALRFVEELIARVTRAGATGTKVFRGDSAFWSKKVVARLQRAGWQYSISVPLQPWVKDAFEQVPEGDWRALDDYPDDGEAQIAQTVVAAGWLIVRRTRLVGAQAELWPDWRCFALVANRTEPLELVENVIRLVRATRAARPTGSFVKLISSYSTPRRSSSAFA